MTKKETKRQKKHFPQLETTMPAAELNEHIRATSPALFALLSELGKRIYLPKGILSQTAEANTQAHRFNATRAIALESGEMMHLDVSRALVPDFISAESIYGYAPVLGQPELRQKWETHLRETNPSLAQATFSLPIVTSGMTHGLSLLAELFVDSGDTLVLPDKIWGNYRLIFESKAQAKIKTYPFYDAEYRFNTDGFRKTLVAVDALCKRAHLTGKILILLNFPHNPTGYAPTRTEARAIVNAIVESAEAGNHLLVMLDDAYAGFWYDDAVMHESLFGMLAGCHPNVVSVKIDGATKEEYAWGMRVGFLTFALDTAVMQPLEQKISGLIRANTSGAAQIAQTLILQAMNAPDYTEQKRHNYETLKARALKVKQIASNARYAELWEVYPSHAGYFTCLRLKSGNAESVRQKLLTEHGIGTIAISESELRVAYSCLEVSEGAEMFAAIASVVSERSTMP